MLQHFEVQLPEGVNKCGGQFADGHFDAEMQHPLLAFLGFLFQYLDFTNPGASDCLLLCPSLDRVPEMVPEECQHHFLLIATF
jgi:hypothetical protein